MLMNNTWEGVLGDLAADSTVFSALLMRRILAQGANVERTELKQPQALPGITKDVEVFSYHETALFDLTIMIL